MEDIYQRIGSLIKAQAQKNTYTEARSLEAIQASRNAGRCNPYWNIHEDDEDTLAEILDLHRLMPKEIFISEAEAAAKVKAAAGAEEVLSSWGRVQTLSDVQALLDTACVAGANDQYPALKVLEQKVLSGPDGLTQQQKDWLAIAISNNAVDGDVCIGGVFAPKGLPTPVCFKIHTSEIYCPASDSNSLVQVDASILPDLIEREDDAAPNSFVHIIGFIYAVLE